MKKGWFDGVATAEIIALGVIQPLGPIAWNRVRKVFKSCREFLAAGESGWQKSGLAAAQVAGLVNRATNVAASERLLTTKNIQLITLDDPEYPPLLKQIFDPPLWLYYRGDIATASQKAVSIVGTRKPSSYAFGALSAIVSQKLASNIVIASGLAYGIDKAAHELSLKHGGKTVAVLAGGLDSIYPTDHFRLADKIIETGGVLISEYPPLDRPLPWKFPVRNRILAGLAPATVVIEAKIKSGSLTTAKSVVDYNRDLFAVPGDISRHQAEGTNFLIKKGAMLLDDADQLDDYYGLRSHKSAIEGLAGELKQCAALLASEPQTIDQLLAASKKPIETLLGIITQLELLELVAQDDYGRYCLRK